MSLQALESPTAPQPCCAAGPVPKAPAAGRPAGRVALLLAAALAAWIAAYAVILPLSNWLTFDLLSLAAGSHLGEAVAFFLYDVPKVLLLLTLIVFLVGIVRSFFTAERTRAILVGKRESVGNVVAALPGVVTPFCSCSAIPLFLGFVESASLWGSPSPSWSRRRW